MYGGSEEQEDKEDQRGGKRSSEEDPVEDEQSECLEKKVLVYLHVNSECGGGMRGVAGLRSSCRWLYW